MNNYTGMRLPDLVAQLKQNAENKVDLIAPSSQIVMTLSPENGPRLVVGEEAPLTIRETAHGQLAQYTGIPARYYRRMRDDAPGLLAYNVNEWLQRAHSEDNGRRMVRTLDGAARAVLSPRYRPLDNLDLFVKAVAPVLLDPANVDRFQVVSCDLSPDRLFLKVACADITFKPGSHRFHEDGVIHAGIVISNSETGQGSMRVEPMFFMRWCENMAIMATAHRRYHVGRVWQEGNEEAEKLVRDETRKAEDSAYFQRLHDIVKGSFDQTRFTELAEQWQAAEQDTVPDGAKVRDVVEVVANRHSLTQDETDAVLERFIRDQHREGLTRCGLSQAVTAAAKGVKSYDRQTDLQRAGGQILGMEPDDWQALMKPLSTVKVAVPAAVPAA